MHQNKLVILAEFYIKVYFPTWFDIKSNNSITDGPRNFKPMQKIVRFHHKQVRNISTKVIQRNAFYDNQEAVILVMLDEDNDLRRVAVTVRYKYFVAHVQGLTLKMIGLKIFTDYNLTNNDTDGNVMQNHSVIEFLLFSLNSKAKSFHKMVYLNEQKLQEPPVLRNLTDIQVEALVVVVVVVTRPLPRDRGMAEDHGAPEAGQLPRAWTSDRRETESRQRVSGANSL